MFGGTGTKYQEALITTLLSLGADINATDSSGDIALVTTIWHNNPNATKQLITAGIDVNHMNNEGLTALTYAKRFGNNLIVKILTDANAL